MAALRPWPHKSIAATKSAWIAADSSRHTGRGAALGGSNPKFATGISPRSFWADSGTWPDVIRRRRTDFTAIKPGDAAIFFSGVKDYNPDIQAKKGSDGEWIARQRVQGIPRRAGKCHWRFQQFYITNLEIAESSGAPSIYGGNGVNVRTAQVNGSGKSGSYVYAQVGNDECILFLAPIPGTGPELPYGFSDES